MVALAEAKLIKVKEAAKRLDLRYPLLAQRGSLFESIQPRYSGVVKRVPEGEYDQVGSLLGPFLLVPSASEDLPDIPSGFYAGLAQLDLDNVARVTGRNVGSGLLQVFMRDDYLGDSELGSLAIRVIPRRIVDHVELDQRYSYEPDEEDLQEQAEIDKLRETDPGEAEKRLISHHFDRGMFGFDWLLSTFYANDYYSVPHEITDSGEPLQIISWEEAGYEMPNPFLWQSDYFNIESVYPSFCEDPDFKIIANAFEDEYPGIVVGLFASDYDDPYEVAQRPELGWKKLFHFDGPISACVIDFHSIYYRMNDGRFEYTGTCKRRAI